jgi:hypothetical protein
VHCNGLHVIGKPWKTFDVPWWSMMYL